ncbi:Indigoidine synthase A-like protein [Mycena indigotica]|uniref:Indigoidine synthase A-like protein n=1 Tax=Mycena indigotica TaxID=2126181 RepID=A0A8H6W5T9_9AGAR|nr:Indigoidine synthase A-like protein [Mycena indigotica]KAF7306884.1 Indigoidine synthase A-like protein [Mycena indigotica]
MLHRIRHTVPRHCPRRYLSQLSAVIARGAPIDVHEEVQDALATGKPVVALETALTTHGLPPPTNLAVTRDLETVVRSTGCIPATIGIVGGRVKIGLDNKNLERLADVNSPPRSVKVSRRDIAPVLALKGDGGTTICATLIFAALAGIKVFATGGLGGVHRGGENSLDISADLHELTRCSVGLVSAGIKSILDIGRTLEYLETLGVPVVAYSKRNDFPAFFSPKSGFQTPWNTDNPRVAAEILHTQQQLGMENGALFAVPIPEEYAERGRLIQEAVDQAVRESESNGMSKRGKDVTPWLLARVAELTKRDSIEANIALLKNSALIGGQIASQYQNIISSPKDPKRATSFVPTAVESSSPSKVMIVGSSAVDITAQITGKDSVGSTSPGQVRFGLGGVARNVAEACHRLGQPPILVSPLGDDAWGALLRDQTKAIGMRTDGFIQQLEQRTAVCNLLLGKNGDLIGGVADMDVTQNLDPTLVVTKIQEHKPSLVALDANLSSEAIQVLLGSCIQNDIPVDFSAIVRSLDEPTSVPKSARIIPAIANVFRKSTKPAVSFFTPNVAELKHVYMQATIDDGLTSSDVWWSAIDRLALGTSFRAELERLAKRPRRDDSNINFLVDEGVAQMAIHLTPFFSNIFVKCGKQGVLCVLKLVGTEADSWVDIRSNPESGLLVAHAESGSQVLIVQHFPSHPTELVNSTGAGDSLVGALLAGLSQENSPLSNPLSLERLIDNCQQAASLTLQSQLAVSPQLNTIVALTE